MKKQTFRKELPVKNKITGNTNIANAQATVAFRINKNMITKMMPQYTAIKGSNARYAPNAVDNPFPPLNFN